MNLFSKAITITHLSKIIVSIVFCLLGWGMPVSMPAQVAVIDYVKVDPDQLGAYLDLEERWEKIHQTRLEKNLIISWGVYEIMFTGSADPYNYVTVTVFNNLDLYDRSWDISFLTDSYPDMSDAEIDAFYKQTQKVKNVVKIGVVHRLLSTATVPGQLPAYVLVNGMKIIPGADTEYLTMEKDVFMPIHEEGIKQNTRAGWALWEKAYGGDYEDYQYITLDAYYSFKQIEDYNSPALFDKLHPNKDFNQVLTDIRKVRTMVSREVWRLIAYVEK